MPKSGPAQEVALRECFLQVSVPIIGPVHENDTNTSVNAMKNMLSKPVVLSAFASMAFDQRDGSVSSNAPKERKWQIPPAMPKRISG